MARLVLRRRLACVNDYDEEPQYLSSAKQGNALLFGDRDDSYGDDQFFKNGGRENLGEPNMSRQPPRLGPLIEEEPEQVSKPSTSNSAKANLARYLFKTKFEGRKRWQKGMPFSQSTRRMFGADTPKEAAAKGLFQPLVGAKMNDARKKQRDEGKLAYNQGRQDRRDNAKGFWSKLWNGITRGRTAMDFFFGARRKPSKSAGALGITSTNAPHGESSGWADQLIDASKAGRLDEGGDDKPAFLSVPEAGQQEQQTQHQSYEHIVDEDKEEEKEEQAPKNDRQLSEVGSEDKAFNNQIFLQNMRLLNAQEEQDQQDSGNAQDEGYKQDQLDNFMYQDDQNGDEVDVEAGLDSEEEEEEAPKFKMDGKEASAFLGNYITSIFNFKQ